LLCTVYADILFQMQTISYSTTVLSFGAVVPSYPDYGINMLFCPFFTATTSDETANLPEDLHCRREEFPGDPDGGGQEEKGLQKGIMKMRCLVSSM